MNERHPLDVISLIFGLLFLGLSLPVLARNTSVELDVRYVLPATVILIGLLVLVTGHRRKGSRPGDD